MWKLTSKDYHNKRTWEASYKILIEKVKTVEPLANKTFVANKINCLRTVFRKELKKVGKFVTGMGADKVYQPKLWCCNKLMFQGVMRLQ